MSQAREECLLLTQGSEGSESHPFQILVLSQEYFFKDT